MTPFQHIPVLVKESVEYLNLKPGGTYVDATLGGGGHAKAILEASETVKLIGIDRDLDALEAARSSLKAFDDRVEFVHSNFSQLKTIFELRTTKLDGILFDLGVSSFQIDTAERGFSFQSDAPLDMRMDRTLKISAKDIVNDSSPEELEGIIKDFGEERYFKRIVSAIVNKRPVSTTGNLPRSSNSRYPGSRLRIPPSPSPGFSRPLGSLLTASLTLSGKRSKIR